MVDDIKVSSNDFCFPFFMLCIKPSPWVWVETMTCFWLSVQFSSVTQSCPTLCYPMNRSSPGLPVHYQLTEFTQTHVHQVGDAIQPSHLLSFPSPPAPNPSLHQGLYQWVNSSHEVAKVLEFQLHHQQNWWGVFPLIMLNYWRCITRISLILCSCFQIIKLPSTLKLKADTLCQQSERG